MVLTPAPVTVAAALELKLESDPHLAQDFKQFLRSKGRKLTDYETIEVYRFAVTVKERWAERRILVGVSPPLAMSACHSSLTLSQGKETLIRMKDIYKVLRYTPGWFSNALQVTNLLKNLPDADDTVEGLKGTTRGAKELKEYLQELVASAVQDT